MKATSLASDPVTDGLWAATLISLPLVGVGLVRSTLGIDVGAGLQPAYLTLALLWAWRLAGVVARERRRALWEAVKDPGYRRVWIALVAVMGAVGISALGLWLAPSPVVRHEAWPRFLRQLIQLAVMVAFTVQAVLWTRGAERWRRTGRWLAVGLATQLIYAPLHALHTAGLADWVAALERVLASNPAILSGSEWLYLGGYTGVPRLRGSMCEPLYLGSFVLGVVPILLVVGRRWLAAAGVLLLVLTWSRGAWLGAAVGGVAWLVLRRRAGLPGSPGRARVPVLASLAGIVALVVLMAGVDALLLPLQRLGQVFDGSDWSNLTRVYGAQAAWRAFLLSPLVGVGWGQFAYHFYAVVDLSGLHSQFTWPVVSSVPLLILSETGLLGLGVATTALAAGLRATWRRLRWATDPAARRRLAAAAVAVVAMGVQMLVFSQYNLPHLWVGLGLWLAALIDADERPGGVA
ncbi:hypothetical protein GF314_11210 [bacterium]|nr:hypothetical protein [bacterium]